MSPSAKLLMLLPITLFHLVITNLVVAAPVVELGVCSDFTESTGLREAVHYAAKVALEEGFFAGIIKNASFEVNIRTADSGCSATQASQVALPLLLGQGTANGRIHSDTVDLAPVVAVSGCYCSAASMAFSQLATPLEVVVVSGVSSNPTLSNKVLHPYFARVIPSDSSQGAGLARLVSTFANQAPSNSWTEVVLMYLQDTYSEGIADAFAAADAVANMTVVKEPLPLLSTRTVELAVDLEYDKLVTIAERILTQNPMARVFVFPSEGDYYPGPIIRAFVEAGLFSNKSVVLTSESMIAALYDEIDRMVEAHPSIYAASIGTSSENYWSPSNYNWTSLDDAVLGWMGLLAESSGARSVSDEWKNFWTGLTPEKLLAAGFPSDLSLEASWFADLSAFQSYQWHPFFFDALTSLFVGIGELLAGGASESELRGPALLQAILAADFEGLTGHIVLDENGDRLGSYRILNYRVNRTLADIGEYLSMSDSVVLEESPMWPSGSTEVPWGRPQPCDPGYEYTAGKCQACPVGQFAATSDSTCVDCPEGSFTASIGTSICRSAPLGMYVPASGSSEAIPCEVGRFSAELGSSACDTCSPGFYADGTGYTECSLCDAGTFTEFSGSSSCLACPSGHTTSGVASRESGDCVCEAGSYALASTVGDPLVNSTCLSCPGGLTCPLGSSDNTTSPTLPVPDPGYMTLSVSPLKAFKCLSDDYCPGGGTGLCGSHRDTNSIACGLCASGAFSAGLECVPCAGGIVDVIFFVGLSTLAVLGVIAVATVASRGAMGQSDNSVMVGLSAGLLLTGVQTLGVFDQLSIEWFEPVATFMSALQLLNFNLSALRTECIWGSEAALGYIARQLVAPMSIPIIILTVSVKFRFAEFRRKIFPSAANATGVVCHIFFISLIVSSSGPFTCYKHPDNSSSMRSSPSTLCFETADHAIMMVAAGVSFFLIPVPFMAIAAYGTLNYPRLLRSTHSSIKLHSLQFLFNRFTPERYYFLPFLLCRSLSICLVPVIFSEAASQVLVLSVILLSFSLLQMRWSPWRGDWVNIMDGTMTLSLELMLVAGSLAAGMTVDESTLSVIGATILACFLSMGIAFPVGFFVRSILGRRKRYQCFLCHHKEDAAAQARLLKMLLQGQHGRRVFIDSDDLRDLGQLFDTVKVDVAQLVVYLTKDTLRRPWCAGEITTAIMHSDGSVKVLAVVTPSFELLGGIFSPEELPDYIDQSGVSLQQYRIFWENVATAYNLLLGSEIPKIKIASPLGERRLYKQLADGIAEGKSLTLGGGGYHTKEPVPLRDGAIVISVDASSDEAIAASGIVTLKLQVILQSQSDLKLEFFGENAVDPCDMAAIRCLKSSRAILFLLSAGSLNSVAQVVTMLQAVSFRSECGSQFCVIPCTLPGFTFPTEAYYEQMLPAIAPSPLDLGSMTPPQTLMKMFFRLIAVVIPTHASDQLLDVQVTEISNRILYQSMGARKTRGSTVPSWMAMSLSLPLSISSSASGNTHSGRLSMAYRVSQLMSMSFSNQGSKRRSRSRSEDDDPSMAGTTSSLAAAAAAAAAASPRSQGSSGKAVRVHSPDALHDQSTCSRSQSQLPKSPSTPCQAAKSTTPVESFVLERQAPVAQDTSNEVSEGSESFYESVSSSDWEVGGSGVRLFAFV